MVGLRARIAVMTRFDRWVTVLSLLVAAEFVVCWRYDWTEVLDALLPSVYGPLSTILLRQYLALFAALAAGVGLALPTLAAADALQRLLARPLTWRSAVVVVSVGLGTLCVTFGNRHFGGYDLSVLVDVAWRYARGQRPYSDFICTLPPAFFVPPGLVFRVFGPSWDSLLALHALLTAAVTAVTCVLLDRLGVPRWLALLLSVATQVISPALTAHWWHSVQAQQAGLVYVLATLLLARAPHRPGRLALYAASLAALLATKVNLVAVLLLVVAPVALWTPSWRRVLLVHAAAITLLASALVAAGVSPVGMLAAYRAIAGRSLPRFGFPPESLLGWHYAFVALATALASWSAVVCWRRGEHRTVLICLGGVASALYAMATNWDTRFNDYPLALFSVTFLAWTATNGEEGQRRRLIPSIALLWVCITVGLVLGHARHRNRHVGYATFFEWNYQAGTIDHPFFAHLRAGPRLHRVVRSADRLLAAEQGTVFFGPRLEFMYAMFERPSPRGLPIWWHAGTSFPLADTALVADRWSRARFDLLVFLRDDDSRMPAEVIDRIRRDHVRDQGDPELTVWRRR